MKMLPIGVNLKLSEGVHVEKGMQVFYICLEMVLISPGLHLIKARGQARL